MKKYLFQCFSSAKDFCFLVISYLWIWLTTYHLSTTQMKQSYWVPFPVSQLASLMALSLNYRFLVLSTKWEAVNTVPTFWSLIFYPSWTHTYAYCVKGKCFILSTLKSLKKTLCIGNKVGLTDSLKIHFLIQKCISVYFWIYKEFTADMSI